MVHQCALDLYAQHHVQVVAQFIGFDPDETRLGMGHGGIELVGRHVTELAGEAALQVGEMQAPEGAAAHHMVFPQPGL
jgi:hypothetical protein